MTSAGRRYLRDVATRQRQHLQNIADALGITLDELEAQYQIAVPPVTCPKKPRHQWTSEEAAAAAKKGHLTPRKPRWSKRENYE